MEIQRSLWDKGEDHKLWLQPFEPGQDRKSLCSHDLSPEQKQRMLHPVEGVNMRTFSQGNHQSLILQVICLSTLYTFTVPRARKAPWMREGASETQVPFGSQFKGTGRQG